MNDLVRSEGLGVRFRFDAQRRSVTPALARVRRGSSEVWGLRGASFSIAPGECVALIGPTGSGKTTLLRALAGVYPADAGRIEVRGRVGSLLSVDAGLMSQLTGRENAELLGVLNGKTLAEARTGADAVRARAELDADFERPVAGWSQGMRARLGFAVADLSAPDILLLDEVHEAFDHDFREVLESRARAMLRAGGAVVAAGHDHPMLERISTRALLLSSGRIAADGPFADVLRGYLGADSETA